MSQFLKINLSRWALEHQAFTRYFLVVLLFGGLLAYGQLGQDEDPPFTFRVMAIRTYWPGATAQQVAEQVIDKLEKKLQEVPFADKIRSYAKPGEGVIILQLKDSTPPKEVPNAWYQTRKKLGDIAYTLPAGVQGPFFNDEFGDTYGTIYALSADGFSYEELRRYSDFVRQEMLHVPNVAKVDLFGVQDEKITIEFSHRKFSQLGIPVTQIIEALGQNNAVEASGVLATSADNVQVRISGQFQTIDDIKRLQLRANGNNIRLGDFAEVKRGFTDPPRDKMHFNGKEVIGVGISMQKGGDIIELGRDLKKVADRLKMQLPVGIEIGQVQDQPQAVTRSVGEFVSVLIEAVVIVLAVSFLSLGLHHKPGGRGYYIDVRPGLVVGLTIPLVLAVTFLLMDIFGIGLHKISLGALIVALGLLVDDAIIAVEMMVRKLEEGFTQMEAATAVWSSTAMPMLTGTLITVAGFLPVGLAKSVAGEYTFSIFAVTAFALVISWFAAVLSTPYLGYLLLRTKSKVQEGEHHELFDTPGYRKIRRAVDWSVAHRKLVISATAAAFLLGGLSFQFIEQQFFPDSSRPELLIEVWLPEGSSFSNTESASSEFEKWVSEQPGVVSVTSFIGTGAPRFYLPLDQILPQTNVAQLIVVPENLKVRSRLRLEIEQAFRERFTSVRGRVKLLPNGPPVPYPVQFRVQGPEPAEVRRIAERVKDIMRANSSTVGVNDNWNEDVKVVRIDVDQEKLRALGVNSQMIAQAANTVLTGTTVGRFREQDRLIDIQLRQPVDERKTVDSIASASIPTASGRAVPLSQLARVSMAWEHGVMWRENRDWAVTVQSDVVDGIQGATVTMQVDPELDKVRANLPAGYYIEIAGALEQSATAGKSIAANLPLTVFVIFTLLMVQLQSFGRALMVFLTGPLGVIGAAFALLTLRAPFGFVAQLGVIALVGMIIRNSVILVDQIEQDRAAGVDAWTAIVESAVRRFRPIVLTAAAAVLAMIPLSRSVFWGPMAVAIMGGLIVATALTMLVLPALYAAWYRVRRVEPAA
jgi:multidrug efflux pump subunit AcrB